MKNPEISIIVPIYNVEKYLHSCMETIFQQTFEDFEVIAVDDGSTDTSGKMADEYALKDARVKVIHQTNKRQGGARNTGIKLAKGKWIAFVDSDDWLDKTFLERLFLQAIKMNADVVMCDYHRARDTADCRKREKLRVDKNLLKYDVVNLKTYNQKLLTNSFSMVVVWNKLWKAEVVKKYLHFPEHLVFEDVVAVPQALIHTSRLSVIKDKLYYYRIANFTSTTKAKDRKHFDAIKTLGMLVESMQKYDFGNFKYFCCSFIVKDLFVHFKNINLELRNKYYNEMRELLCKMESLGYMKFVSIRYGLKAWIAIKTNYNITNFIKKF